MFASILKEIRWLNLLKYVDDEHESSNVVSQEQLRSAFDNINLLYTNLSAII